MQYDLASLVRQTRNQRRPTITIRDIAPTQALAASLYARAYKPLIDAMTAALPGIVAAYDRGLPVNDALIRDATTEAQNHTESLGETLRRLVLAITPALNDWATRTETWHRGKWRGAVLGATGVDPQTILAASGTPATVQETIDWNIALVRDVGQQAQQRMNSAIFSAFQARKPAADLARDLRDVVALSRARSLRIASDQLQKLSGALDRERATEAGLTTYIWKHSHKLHPRPVHVARDGKVFRYDDPPEDGPPGSLPFCGCRAKARITFT